MKKIVSAVIAATLVVSGITSASDAMMMNDTMMKSDGGMMMNSNAKMGMYVNYSAGSITKQTRMGQKVILFFYDSSMDASIKLDADITSHMSAIPTKVTIIKVDVTKSVKIKNMYGVKGVMNIAVLNSKAYVSKRNKVAITTTKDLLVLANVKEEGVMVGGALMVRRLNIVENALNANNVTTVVAAVKAAGLVDTLMSAGPFTVFAPTNAAFDKLPAGTVDTLVKPENKDMLTKILTYHVVAGAYKTSDLYDGQILTTVEGGKLMIKVQDGKVWINGSAMVETADVISSNGVTHVIDTVLMPQ